MDHCSGSWATIGLKEMEKFLWEGREKSLSSWLSQFSFAKLRQPTGQTFFPTFPKEFSHFLKIYGSHSWVLLENAKKNLAFHLGGGRHASFPQKPVVKVYWLYKILTPCQGMSVLQFRWYSRARIETHQHECACAARRLHTIESQWLKSFL